jgi:hypothetical protein
MAIYLTFNSINANNYVLEKFGVTSETPFHVQSDLSEFVPYVSEIQVYGTELAWITEKIPNLPIPDKRVVKFYGDTAKLIVGNLFVRDLFN